MRFAADRARTSHGRNEKGRGHKPGPGHLTLPANNALWALTFTRSRFISEFLGTEQIKTRKEQSTGDGGDASSGGREVIDTYQFLSQSESDLCAGGRARKGGTAQEGFHIVLIAILRLKILSIITKTYDSTAAQGPRPRRDILIYLLYCEVEEQTSTFHRVNHWRADDTSAHRHWQLRNTHQCVAGRKSIGYLKAGDRVGGRGIPCLPLIPQSASLVVCYFARVTRKVQARTAYNKVALRTKQRTKKESVGDACTRCIRSKRYLLRVSGARREVGPGRRCDGDDGRRHPAELHRASTEDLKLNT
ncbi:hypothetical protein EVAR_50951_1 [Eumeta japonica]|uniref:Uncharacterized protein n=1 Tax=Eumeta variegata TaxID=151549 RepID=A0A4C1XEA6_EUMVA|nr:hypothetical protein EVAR_50951_1 [Eumeta japonica]